MLDSNHKLILAFEHIFGLLAANFRQLSTVTQFSGVIHSYYLMEEKSSSFQLLLNKWQPAPFQVRKRLKKLNVV